MGAFPQEPDLLSEVQTFPRHCRIIWNNTTLLLWFSLLFTQQQGPGILKTGRGKDTEHHMFPTEKQ